MQSQDMQEPQGFRRQVLLVFVKRSIPQILEPGDCDASNQLPRQFNSGQHVVSRTIIMEATQ